MNEQIALILGDFWGRSIPHGITRNYHVRRKDGKIAVLIGMRRVGKTYLLFQEISALLASGVPREAILYINFEDDRLDRTSSSLVTEVIDTFYALNPQNHQRRSYLFLDEVQAIKNWSLTLRRIMDSRSCDILLTGSSAKLLSTEIATELRGRSLAQEVWPFSFQEYCVAKGLELPNSIRSVTNKDLVNSWLRSYLEEGGFPETIGEELSIRRTLLRGYVDSVILRDIVERYGVGNISFLRYLIQSLLSNAGQLFSTNKFHNDCKSQGFSIARSTAYDYLEYIEDAYLCFTVCLYTDSIRKRNTNPRKIYAIDQGIVKHYSLRTNWGALFENLVYLDLRRAGYQVWYYKTKSGFEVDFVCEDPIGARRVIQVAYDIQDRNTLEREERALNEARIELNCPGDLVTLDCYHSFIQSLYGNSGSNVP